MAAAGKGASGPISTWGSAAKPAALGTGSGLELNPRRRFALDTTESELSAIAAAAIIALKRQPKNGYSTPAATGMPTMFVAKASGKEPGIDHLEARKEVLHAVADHSKVADVFDYRAKWTLDRGLKQMAEWALSVGPREPSRRADVEIARNLPRSWA